MIQKKVLVVDDEPDVVRILERRLAGEGYLVLKAATGHEAVNVTKASRPHLIVMDILLPDIDGSEAVRLIKDDPATVNIPILFLSGIVTKDEDEWTKLEVQVGGLCFPAIPKPIDLDKLIAEIRKILK